jgi:ribonucleoside-diphosphate reductase alpha chain
MEKQFLEKAAISDNALEILKERYLLKDINGKVSEKPEQLFRRVASFVASAEETEQELWEDRYYDLMIYGLFFPNSPALMNAGLPKGQLSACFVLPVQDTLDSIFSTLKNAALIHQSGGGTGFNFSKLRPKDDRVSSGGTSSGPVAFMKIYDAATKYVKQGGRRRGANMGILNADHPDIELFINSKNDDDAIVNFNLSVGITDTFMNAVEHDLDWSLINPRTKEVQKRVKASHIWQQIIMQAWHNGDPGLIFLDTLNEYNNLPQAGYLETTNPCGEVPLLDYESCNLGSVNLAKMIIVNNGKPKIDWDKLAETVHLGIRFLDSLIDLNYYLLPQIETITKAHRKIGLGVMGWAEMLIKLEIPYASKKAVKLAEKLMLFIKNHSYRASVELARFRGAFSEWKNSVFFNNRWIHNATCNSIAPTGTLAVIANTSYGIEPLFALAYDRVGILNDKNQTEINALFVNKMKVLGFWNEKIKKQLIQKGTMSGIRGIPKDIRKLFETSLEIPWKYHLLHQKAFQKYTDNAVSKTINLPENASVNEISEIYKTAWKYKLKGITVFRYGSKPEQVLQRCSLDTRINC